MKRLLLLPLLLAAACQAPGGKRLTVLSWNLHHGADAREVRNLEDVAAWIRALAPDAAVLQEVDRRTGRSGGEDQIGTLAAATGLSGFFGRAMDWDGGEYGEGALTALPVLDVEVHPLPHRPGSEPRAALELRLRLPGGAEVAVVGTHLDHQREPADRSLQARALAEILARPGRPPTVLAGDLNADLDAAELAPLAALAADACAASPRPTFPAEAPRVRLDHVLLIPPGAWRVLEAGPLPEAAAPSDHLPVRALLELRSSSAGGY